ncbi:hypothetical protein NDU88_006884 [Pleurodeles waltl]|uniref:Uncharacterized protein n=1 Tax=Pleurodeles waltl TaxID=8319 RepID=A0AAV7PK14_PLEWA|nr:hypothetical protein NDU88_006884 [Pleurodeles waltl]
MSLGRLGLSVHLPRPRAPQTPPGGLVPRGQEGIESAQPSSQKRQTMKCEGEARGDQRGHLLSRAQPLGKVLNPSRPGAPPYIAGLQACQTAAPANGERDHDREGRPLPNGLLYYPGGCHQPGDAHLCAPKRTGRTGLEEGAVFGDGEVRAEGKRLLRAPFIRWAVTFTLSAVRLRDALCCYAMYSYLCLAPPTKTPKATQENT